MSLLRLRLLLLLCSLFLLMACDKGLEPEREGTTAVPTGTFTGLVTFQNWQSAGTVYDMRLVAFTIFPPGNVVNEVLQGRAVVYPPLGGPSLIAGQPDSLRYVVSVPAGTYPYVVIAQQFGPNVNTDWRAVGQYDLDTNYTVPSPVVVQTADTTGQIDIRVDFANPPPPPPQ